MRQTILIMLIFTFTTQAKAQMFKVIPPSIQPAKPAKSKSKLGWTPKYDLQGLVTDMMISDIKLMKKDAWLREGGYRTLNYFE